MSVTSGLYNVFHLWANGRCVIECHKDLTEEEGDRLAKLAEGLAQAWMHGSPLILPAGWRLEYHSDAPARFPQTVAQ